MERKTWIEIIIIVLIILIAISFGLSYLIVNFMPSMESLAGDQGYEDGKNTAAIQYSIERFKKSEGRFPSSLDELLGKYPDIEDNLNGVGENRIRYSQDEDKGYILRFCGFDNILDTDDDIILDHLQYMDYLKSPFRSQSVPYYYSLFGTIWEFHPEYIQITDFANTSNDYPVTTLMVSSITVYSSHDIYDITHSENIGTFEYKSEKMQWRNEVYDNVEFNLYPRNIIENGEPFFFTLRYKTNRLPHLHTEENISPSKELHLGINSGPCDFSIERRFQIIAIPSSAEIIDVFQYPPIKTKEIGDWKLFYYDISNIEDRIGIHIKFKLNEEDVEPIDVERVLDAIP
jgi:hypothetical protein